MRLKIRLTEFVDAADAISLTRESVVHTTHPTFEGEALVENHRVKPNPHPGNLLWVFSLVVAPVTSCQSRANDANLTACGQTFSLRLTASPRHHFKYKILRASCDEC